MTTHRLAVQLLDERLAVCRLPANASIPSWALAGELSSVTRSVGELSVVCAEAGVPEGVECESGWRAIRVAGPLDFSLTGVLSSLAAPLAEAGISIFALSTFDTDYLLIREPDLARAVETLRAAGHTLSADSLSR